MNKITKVRLQMIAVCVLMMLVVPFGGSALADMYGIREVGFMAIVVGLIGGYFWVAHLSIRLELLLREQPPAPPKPVKPMPTWHLLLLIDGVMIPMLIMMYWEALHELTFTREGRTIFISGHAKMGSFFIATLILPIVLGCNAGLIARIRMERKAQQK